MSVSEKRDWYDKNCNKGTRRMFRNIYGLDLGTYEIKIYVREETGSAVPKM